ncbi:unnamed protein product [Calypogeia fissa]
MTFFLRQVFLVLVLSIWSWIGARGQPSVEADGRLSEGKALEVFFNATRPSLNFQGNKTCDWNVARIVCDNSTRRVISLNLSRMDLAGPIPTGTISNLTGLKYLDLSNNQLNGGLPVIDVLTNLTDMYLGGNKFTGPLNDSNFPHKLVNLDLSSNILSGNVTALVESLGSLSTLDLSSNGFTDESFPSDFSDLVNLTTLNLASNNFTKHIFPILPKAGLMNLSLAGTNMVGTIPENIAGIVSLLSLNLSHNKLDGRLPLQIGNLNKLQMLDLSRNNLSGQLPANMENMTSLSNFNVSYNNFSGPLPSGLRFDTFSLNSYLGDSDLCGLPFSACPPAPAPSPVNETAFGREGKSTNIGAIIGGVLGGIVFLSFFGAALLLWCRHSRAVKPLARDEARHVSGPMQYEKDAETWATGISNPGCISVVMFEKPLLNLSFADLLNATRNFSKDMQVSDGGYGPVYKGVLPDGTQLAVKVLVDVQFTDGRSAAEKIEGLAKVKHPNLVTLIGYCFVNDDSLLIYEFMVNGPLQKWIHEIPDGNGNFEDWSHKDGSKDWSNKDVSKDGSKNGSKNGSKDYGKDGWDHLDGAEDTGEYLNWPTRHKIVLGTARALAFLHHGCSPHVIHRDVKTSNILLDETFEAHLVDSGLAGIARVNGTPIIGGTLGYVPPEYGQTWQATTRGDVYSFGVVLLELVTGRRPTGHYFHESYGGNLVGWVRSTIKQDKRGQKALDPKLVSRGHVPEMLEVLRIGYLCTAETPAKRPTMQQVVGLLKDCQGGVMS